MEMIKVNVENVKGILVTTSNRVAEELGVEHKNLLTKIDNYVKQFGGLTLSHEFYIENTFKNRGKDYRNYLITQKGIAQLTGGYNASVSIAFALNVAYINEFERMRKELQGKRPMTRKMESIRNEITLDNKLTYHGTPILITRQLNKLVGYDISLKLSKVKGRSILRNEKVKELKKENNILSNWITYTAVYYEENLNELLQKVKELKVYEPELVAYFTDSGTKLKLERRDIEIALRLLDNITDTAVKERISIGILEKLGYQSN